MYCTLYAGVQYRMFRKSSYVHGYSVDTLGKHTFLRDLVKKCIFHGCKLINSLCTVYNVLYTVQLYIYCSYDQVSSILQ